VKIGSIPLAFLLSITFKNAYCYELPEVFFLATASTISFFSRFLSSFIDSSFFLVSGFNLTVLITLAGDGKVIFFYSIVA